MNGLANITEREELPEEVFRQIFGRSRPDGYIALGTRRKRKFHPNGEASPHFFSAVKVQELNDILPGILKFHRDQVEKHGTLYLCPNTLTPEALRHPPEEYRAAIQEGRPLYYEAKKKFVRELNAIVVDLDVGRGPDDLQPGQAIGAVYDRALRGALPWPSMIALSGRGVYVLWLLRESESSDLAPLAQDHEHQWRITAQVLLKQTHDLKSDPNAARMNNWYKAPGTIDTSTGHRVRYFLSASPGQPAVPVYTLDQFKRFFSLQFAQPDPAPLPDRELVYLPPEITPRKSPPAPRITEGKRARRGGNPGAPYRLRYEDIEKLAVSRGGISEGFRHFTVLFYFSSLRAYYRNAGRPHREAWSQAQRAAERFNQGYCRPPLPDSDLQKCFGHRPPKEANTAKIVCALGITEAEARALELRALQPPKMKAETMQKTLDRRNGNRARRALVDCMLSEGRPAAEITRAGEARGFTISRALVSSRKKSIIKPPTPDLFTASK